MRTAVPVQVIGAARLTAGLDRHEALDLGTHLAIHGPLPVLSLPHLVALSNDIVLCGRGGAGFPFARKLQAVWHSARDRACEVVIVVNATEGEPGSLKDRMLLRRAPHVILDGAFLVARAMTAHSVVIAVAEGEPGAASLARAVAERNPPILTRVTSVPDRFISGESGALVRGLNGDVPIPPGRKVRASHIGVHGLPTLLSNAETFAQLAVAARLGPYGYAAVGLRTEPGTVLLTVAGSSRHPAVVETPTGVRLADILAQCGATVGEGVLVGGFHGRWMSPDSLARAVVSREGLAAEGGSLGAGVVLPLGEETCPLGEVARVLAYLAGESAGQCGPCRRGLPELADRLATAVEGGARAAAAGVRAVASELSGRGACGHPDGTAQFALSAIETFRDDLDAHESHEGCGRPVRGVLPVPATAAGRRLIIDWTRCDGHGLCASIAPELVSLDVNGYPDASDRPVPEWLDHQARRAVSMCPALALRLVSADPHRR